MQGDHKREEPGKSQNRQNLVVTSSGLWRLRHDIEQILDCNVLHWSQMLSARSDGFIGWGRKQSGQRAVSLALRRQTSFVLLEDGFIKSYAPGAGEPGHAFVADRRGMYFDVAHDNDLAHLLAAPAARPQNLQRASDLIGVIRGNRLSKYNNSPLRTLASSGIPAGRPFVLLVDQVAGDASIAGAMASAKSFEQMLKFAAEHYPNRLLVVRTHPAAGRNSLLRRAAETLGLQILVPERMNPWPLLEEADAVLTVSSQLGFEALMAAKTVHCFGVTYYSGLGLTSDHNPAQAQHPRQSLEQLFHAAYLQYTTYLDLHDRSRCSAEQAIDQAITVKNQRNRLPAPIFTGGLSPWKRGALAPFLVGPSGPARHCLTLGQAASRAAAGNGTVALWGTRHTLPGSVAALRFEDGFIRSRGLGAALTLPSSLTMDSHHPYFDARGASGLEKILQETEFPDALLQRAAALTQMMTLKGISKYNLASATDLPDVESGRTRILVPGQVEKDASIRYGSPRVKTNQDLVSQVRALYPQAFIAYKEHPDVTSGLRSGGTVPVDADVVVRGGDITGWIAWADRIETMTSLTGFEALIRGKPVGCHGIPFYAGWGLTDDREAVTRRTRKITRDMLVAGTLILYPLYSHPVSRMPCSPEELIAEIAANRPMRLTGLQKLTGTIARKLNRIAIKIRDKRA